MKYFLPLFVTIALGFTFDAATAQSFLLRRAIMATDTITDEGRTFAASTDDAEQENDEMDSLYDDDIDAGWEGEPDDQNILTAGFRFRNIFIPQGATIDSVFLVLTSHEAKTTEDVANLTIVGDASDNAGTFTLDSLIDARPQTTAAVRWIIDEEYGLYTTHRTPDLREIVQEIIDRDGWVAGNALALLVLGENQGPSELENAREFESFENIADPEDGGDGQHHPERIPMLEIYYSIASAMVDVPIMATDTITDEGRTFAASSDDAEQENDEMDALFDDDIDAGWEGEPDDQNILTAGFRFRGLAIPKGAVIDSAYMVLFSHEAKTTEDVANLTIIGDAADNAGTFTLDSLIDMRPRTEATVRWVVDEVYGLYTEHRTPDISSIVQEIVDRDGWEPGNAMAFMVLGENQGPSELENAREWESFENIADPEDGGDGQHHPERVPRLVVFYSSPGMVSSVFDQYKNIKELKLYPNPANNMLNIELETDAPAQIELYNLNGQMLKAVSINFGGTVQLDVSQLQKGMYVVKATQNNEIYTQKLVIE